MSTMRLGRTPPLLPWRLDAQQILAKLFADLGTEEDVRRADDLDTLLAGHYQVRPGPSLRPTGRDPVTRCWADCAHSLVLFGSSKFLGRDELGHSRTTVGLTRSRGVTVVAGPPDPYRLIGRVQTIYCYYHTAHSTTWELDAAVYPFKDRPHCLRFRCNTQRVLRLVLPTTSTALLEQDGFTVELLPKLAFFTLWDRPPSSGLVRTAARDDTAGGLPLVVPPYCT